MEILATPSNQNVAKISLKFYCETCDYHTSKRLDYEKHIATRKHQKATLATDQQRSATENISDDYRHVCENCNRKYNDRSGLWRHRKLCVDKSEECDDGSSKLKNTTNIMIELIKQNQELKNILIEQNNTMLELSKTNSQAPQISNSTIHNTQNNQFNLNFFLNEQCKDAVNLMDFVNSIQLQVNDLENTAKCGFVEGISRIFITALEKLDIYKRPLHCTDLKRDTLYIKDQDKWEKEKEDKGNIKRAIGRVVDKNLKQIANWEIENPEFMTSNTKQQENHIKLLLSALGGSTPDETDKNSEKIVKNIAKEVLLNKSTCK